MYIYLAEIDGRPIGTITYTIDNQFGLMVDDDFHKEIAQFRIMYHQVSSVWRFAVLPEYQSNLKVMRRLIEIAFYQMKENNIPICFLTISPTHARVYKKMMNMEEVARGFDSNKLIKPEHAEVVLLVAYGEKVPDKWYPHKKEAVVV